MKISALGFDRILAPFVRKSDDQSSRYQYTEVVRKENRWRAGKGDGDGRKADIWSLGFIGGCLLEDVPDMETDIQSRKLVGVRYLVNNCAAKNQRDRPEINQFLLQLKSISGRSKDNFIQEMMKRLENYTEVLERAVRTRVEELKMEQMKCDELLREILPL